MPAPPAHSQACFRIATWATSGAVAIIELFGEVDAVLRNLLGGKPWPVGACRLRHLADMDTAIVVRVSDGLAWLMPHGGPRIVQRLTQWLIAAGIAHVNQPDEI